MTEKEYREFLEALWKRYFRPPELQEHAKLKLEMGKLLRTSRFVEVVSERPEQTELYPPLGKELEQRSDAIASISNAFEKTGVSDALDEHREIVFANLSRDVVPDADIILLRKAGIQEPEAELTLIIYHSRSLAQSKDFQTSNVLKSASDSLTKVAQDLKTIPESDESVEKKEGIAKQGKYITAIGKILAGTILGVGNLLIGTEIIVAPGGAIGASVITSCATAVGAVTQGLGELYRYGERQKEKLQIEVELKESKSTASGSV